MYKHSASSWLKYLDFTILDLVSLQTSFVLAYMIRHGFSSPYRLPLYREMAVIFVLINLIVMFFNESYSDILKREYLQEFKAVFQHVSVVIVISSVCLFLLQKADKYSRITFIVMWILNIFICYLLRMLWKYYLRNIRKSASRYKSSLLVIASYDRAEIVLENLIKNDYNSFKITGVCVIDRDMKGGRLKGIPVVADKCDVLDYICRSWVDEVILNISRELPISEKLLKSCMEMGVTVHLTLTRIAGIYEKKQIVENLGGYTVLSTSINMVSAKQLIAKRIMDIFGGVIGVLITALLFVFVAPCIYIKSPGPIFFSQTRVGKNGKKFKLYKFRSMYMDAEERKKELQEQNKIKDGFMFKIDNDPRIIGGEKGKGIGNFIRNTSIDEFPQFWNVLKGDMSLVGTRPPTVDEWERYELHHRKRLAIKPGITGMWQVNGRSNITDFEKVVELDTRYIVNWSLGLDFRILFKTVVVVLLRKGSE